MAVYKNTVYVVVIKDTEDFGVFIDKSGAAKFLGVHRNTIFNRLKESDWYEDNGCILSRVEIKGSKRGGGPGMVKNLIFP